MVDTFKASSNAITISNNSGSAAVFDTGYRMPHVLSSVSGTFNSTNATISTSGGVFINTVTDNVVASNSFYQFNNSFVWAWVTIITNPDRTDLTMSSPIFLTGSIILRFWLANGSLRGSYVLTPMIYNGGVGFREEWQYADNTNTTVPGNLFPTDSTNTNGNMGLTYSYTLYYGRFI